MIARWARAKPRILRLRLGDVTESSSKGYVGQSHGMPDKRV